MKKAQLAYYKLGDGPFYVFYTPFHLPHVQIVSTIGRAVLHRDPTVAPLAGPVCEVVTVAKRDLKAGERLDGIGGFCTYGLIDNATAARNTAAPADRPLGRLTCRVEMFPRMTCSRSMTWRLLSDGVSLALWREQKARWPVLQLKPRKSN